MDGIEAAGSSLVRGEIQVPHGEGRFGGWGWNPRV
jgi:hypothetical protein